MMPAVKHLDPIVGVDIHLIITPPGPVVPIPHPHIGMVFDPFDYIPIIGSTVNVNGLPRAQAGTGGIEVPPHIPIGGAFAKPPSNENETFMGSATVAVDGDAFTHMTLQVLSCQDIGMPSPPRKRGPAAKTLLLPTSIVLSIPAGPPVRVGGPPTISLMGLLTQFALGALLKGLKKLRKLQKASRKMKALSNRMHKAAEKVMDKLGLGQRARNRIHRAICSVTGHPVDVATGKVLTEAVDFALPGPLSLVWRRVWFSTSTYAGDLGHGWHHTYDLAVFPFAEAIVVRLEDGRHIAFSPPLPGEKSWNSQEQLFLLQGQAEYVLQTGNGVLFYFESPSQSSPETIVWPLARIQDRYGNTISFERSHGRMVGIHDSAGRHLSVHRDKWHRIIAVEGPAPSQPTQRQVLVRYEYDAWGDLVAIYDAMGNAQRFSYRNHLLVQETGRDGVSFHFDYDDYAPHGRCTHTWGSNGILERWLTYDLLNKSTTVKDSRNAMTLFEWNELGLATRRVDALGNEQLYDYDDDGDILAATNALGHTTHYVRDEFKRIVCIEDPMGAKTEFVYDAVGGLAEVHYPDGSMKRNVYDEFGTLLQEIEPGGSTWRYEVDARGLCTKEIDPNGNFSTYSWSRTGDLIAFRDPSGAETHYHYDALGRPTIIRDPLGDETRLDYDKCDRLACITNPTGGTRRLVYDAAGQLIEDTDALGRTRRYVYGPMGHCVASQTPLGAWTRFEYDKEMALTTIQNRAGHKYLLHRDVTGRLIEEDAFGRRHRYEYDAAGRVIAKTDARGLRTLYGYDAADRCITRRFSDGQEESFKYDKAGRLIEAMNSAARVLRKYDLAGNLLSERINNEEVRYEYDAAGNCLARCSPLGRLLELSYDACDRLSQVTDEKGTLLLMRYNAFGEEIERSQRGGVRSQRQYTSMGRLFSSQVTRDDTPIASSVYTYDATGYLTATVDEFSGRTERVHDAAGRLIKTHYSDKSTEIYSYDAAGNVAAAPEAFLPPSNSGALVQENFNLRFDADGNLVEKSGPSSRLSFKYDAAGRMIHTSIELATGERRQLDFGYDPFGRRVKKKVYEGQHLREVTFFWDMDSLLGEKESFLHATDANSNSKPSNDAIRVRPPSEYLTRSESLEPLVLFDNSTSYFIESDANSTPRLAFDSKGRAVWGVELSGFGVVRNQIAGMVDVPLRFPGQYEDAETGLLYNRFRYYDPQLAMYTSVDPLGYEGGLNLWNYVPSPADGRDPYGLVGLDEPGYFVYGLYDPPGPPTKEPYYIGITNDNARRQTEHINTNRLDPNAIPDGGGLHELTDPMKYGDARGYEQAYMEHYKTRNGEIGKEISSKNRGNKVWSFDMSRTDHRAKRFKRSYNKKMKDLRKLKAVCT